MPRRIFVIVNLRMGDPEDEPWWQYDALEEWKDLHPRLRWLPRVLGWVQLLLAATVAYEPASDVDFQLCSN